MRLCAYRFCGNEAPPMTGTVGQPAKYCSVRCRVSEHHARHSERRNNGYDAKALRIVREAVADEVPCGLVPCRCGRDYATLPL